MHRAFIACVCLLGCAPVDEAYPPGPYSLAVGGTIADLTFAGVTEAGIVGEIALHDFYAPGTQDRLLVMVSGGAWCGTCRWPAKQHLEVHRLDVVIGDRDNAPADVEAAMSWQRSLSEARAVGADPEHRLLWDEALALPLFLLIDASTMQIVDVASNPSSAELRALVGDDAEEPPLVDDFFYENEWDLLRETTLPGPPPADPTNAFADSPAAAALGRALFFDTGLSPSGTVACATCHQPDRNFSDGLPRAQGVAEGDRRTPSIALAAHARWQFWDGRADTMWAQALGPLENPRELASSRTFVASRISTAHRDAYRAAYAEDPTDTTRVFVNAGKAIEAFERTLRVEPNPLDLYLQGDFAALSPEQKYGLQLFVRTGCMQCHWGPRLTDDAFHDLRLPTGRRDGAADAGRLDGVASYQASEFRSDGPWSDARSLARNPTAHPSMLGQFKTPPLRGIADAKYFGHGGTFTDLALVTESYGTGGVPDGDPTSAGTREPWLPLFGETAQWGLVPFLSILSAKPSL